jgi:hypothetical protein
MSFEPIRIGNTVIKLSSESVSASLYEIKNEASPFLMKSISNAINLGNGNSRTTNGVVIEAVSVLTMRDYLKRNRHATELYVALRLVHNLGKQMQALISAGRSIACIGVDDVVVITHRDSDSFVHDSINDPDSTLGDSRMDPQFLFLNDHLIFELDDDDGTLIVDRALTKTKAKHACMFMSPELSELLQAQQPQAQQPQAQQPQAQQPHQLQLHFKTIYYSVAQLVIYFLLNVDRIPDDDDIAYLNPIKNTKLYWFLLRCLNPVPAQRKYIYI